MKIFHVLNHFLPQQTAGTEVYAWALCKQLQQQGHEVEIIIPHYGAAASIQYKYDGLQVFQYAEPSIVDRSLIMGFRKPDGLAVFEKYLEEQQPALVHFHELAGSNGITIHHMAAAKKMGAKVLMTFHLAGYSCKTGTLLYKEEALCDGLIEIRKCSSCYLESRTALVAKPLLLAVSSVLFHSGIDTTKLDNKLGTALGTGFVIQKLKKNFEAMVAHCDKVVVLTQWYKKMLLLNGVREEKISFIAQGLPFAVTEDTHGEKTKAGLPIRLIFLGRIGPLKGLHLLIEALQHIPEDKIMLSIYGQSGGAEYETALRKKSAGKNNILWQGKLKQEDVLHTMQLHDVLCLCSTFSEMSPLVIQEAFAAGIPVLSSNVYGNAEQITEGYNGWLFTFKDSADLKDKLQMLIADPSLIDGARKNIPAIKNFETVSNEYALLYKEILAVK